ncbi:MAG: hypothetical protein KatS3mg097_644 [Candidatus Parcubacteria bacterium]|nr:MAG: hypothetical protein KatS3mg097_644 [Candidatus Parcubacteria bacterium]
MKEKLSYVILKKLASNYENVNNFEFLKYFKKSSIDKFHKTIKNYPESWKKINFKTYARFSNVLLNKNFGKDELLKIIFKRRSERNFQKYPLSLKEISYFLLGATITKVFDNNFDYNSFRAYPSAGARYSLEVYLFLLSSKDLKRGLYHYNVRFHCLEYMWDFKKKDLIKIFNQKFILNSSLIIFITCVIKRIYPKYGERSLRLALLEAGHLAQNFLLLATKLGLKSCPVGGFKEQKILEILDISQEEQELPLYCIIIGK